jgi:FkbM family methyltransferase
MFSFRWVFLLYIALLSAVKGYSLSWDEFFALIRNRAHPLEIVRPFLPVNPHILEAGAHYGEDTLNMRKIWPNSTLYAFEPHPISFARLKTVTQSLPRLFVYPYALFHYNGTSSFSLVQANEGASSVLPAHPDYCEATHKHDWWYNEQMITVPCRTLDTWASQEKIHFIDFMWLDMEGAELPALQAGTNLLKTVKVIYTEVNFQEFRTGMTQYDDLVAFLAKHDFVQIYIDTPDRSFQANAIFVKKHLLPN